MLYLDANIWYFAQVITDFVYDAVLNGSDSYLVMKEDISQQPNLLSGCSERDVSAEDAYAMDILKIIMDLLVGVATIR